MQLSAVEKGLLSLPRELRNAIYSELGLSMTIEDVDFEGGPNVRVRHTFIGSVDDFRVVAGLGSPVVEAPDIMSLLSLMSACRCLRDEIGAVLWDHCLLKIEMEPLFRHVPQIPSKTINCSY